MLSYAGFGITVLAALYCSRQVGAQNVQISPPRDQIICSSSAVNVTYNCTADSGSVIWQLGEYQVVDRDQFMNSGVLVHVQTDELTYLTLGIEGREFLREQFDSDTIYVRCFSTINNLNLYFSERYMVKVYDTSNSGTPEVSEVKCNGDGRLDVTIRIEPIPVEGCPLVVNYTVSVGGVTRVVDDTLTAELRGVASGQYMAEVTECTDTDCTTIESPLNVACAKTPAVTYYKGYTALTCGFNDGGDAWGCQFVFTIDGEEQSPITLTNKQATDGYVAQLKERVAGDQVVVWDVLPNGTRGSALQPPTMTVVTSDDTFPAAISTQEECDEECDLPVLYIAIAAVLGVLLGALLGAVSTAVVFKCCCSRGGEDKKDFIKLQPKS